MSAEDLGGATVHCKTSGVSDYFAEGGLPFVSFFSLYCCHRNVVDFKIQEFL